MATERRSASLIKGATGDWEVIVGLEVHAQVTSRSKLFSGASTAFGGEPNTHVSLVDAAMPGMLPVINRECVAQAVRTGPRAQGEDQSAFDLRPKELFLSRPAAGLSDFPVQEPDRRRRRDPRRPYPRPFHHGRDRAAASRAGRWQVPARPIADDELRRPQSLWGRPDGDRLQARHALGRGSESLCRQAAHHSALHRLERRRHGEGQSARRRQRLRAPPRRSARHPVRDQERQLHPLHRPGDRGRGAAPDRARRGRRQGRPGDAAVRSGAGRDALDAFEGGSA